jgi:hypothetical protein
MLDMDTSYSQMSPDSLNLQLPNRTKAGGQYGAKLGVMEQVPTPNSEMDFSTTGDPRQQKSPSNSYKDASSHASFTPPTGDSASTSGVGSLPKGSPGSSNMPTPGSLAAAAAAATDSLFFEMADASFSSFQQSQFFAATGPMAFGASPSPRSAAVSAAAPPGVSVDVAMSSTAAAQAGGGWDMGGIETAVSSTGLSPMVTESWSDVLSSVADWSGVAAEHQGFARARRS